jgi:2-keto-4-pentenoate hydratase/2-oxohepta-3-ene-1,7-dioic acid hydratase in catechol pathway
MFSPTELALERGWPGRIEGERVVQLAAQTLQAFFTGGGGAREHAEYPLAECVLRAPVLQPPSVRVFTVFEPAPAPSFVFVNPFPVLGPDEELRYPEGSNELVFRAAVAAVVGAEGTIGGFTAANLWTARDLARAERADGCGPSKSADFGLSLGPVLVTPDGFTPTALRVNVNGESREQVALETLAHGWPRLRDHAARNTTLRPGELLIAAAPIGEGPALVPGDEVVIELDGVGALRSRIGARALRGGAV